MNESANPNGLIVRRYCGWVDSAGHATRAALPNKAGYLYNITINVNRLVMVTRSSFGFAHFGEHGPTAVKRRAWCSGLAFDFAHRSPLTLRASHPFTRSTRS